MTVKPKTLEDTLNGLLETGERLTKERREAEKQRKVELENRRKENVEPANQMAKDSVEITQYRNHKNLMGQPIFSTRYGRKTKRETGRIHYEVTTERGTRRYTVTAGGGLELPDEIDGNILRFAISKGREVQFRTGYFPDLIHTTRYELCREMGLQVCGQTYESLTERLKRLAGARIHGNFFSYDEDVIYSGSLISTQFLDSDRADAPVDIAFPVILRQHLEETNECLVISSEIMKMRNPLKVRICELVDMRMGRGECWRIGLEKLREDCSVRIDYELKFFKRDLTRLELPYDIEFSGGRKLSRQIVCFRKEK